MILLQKNVSKAVNVLKKFLMCVLVGVLCGMVGTVFHTALEYVTVFRENNPFIIIFLPFAGFVIVGLYNLFKSKGNIDIKRVFQAVTENKDVPVVMMPLIVAGTLITHLFGGSAGREGAAFQLGGSLGFNVATALKQENNKKYFVTAGMSGVFAALFGTPLTAAIFSLEVTGTLFSLNGVLMGVVSSITAFAVANFFGVEPVRFVLPNVFEFSFDAVIKVFVLSVLCACICVVFAITLNGMKAFMKKYIPNIYVRVALGGFVVVALTAILRTTDYNGAGMNVITRALSGKVHGLAFLLKMIFTAITVSSGFKGGEIVPTFFIGATFGCFAGNFVGIDSATAACIGFVALFSGMTKCPVAAFLLAAEVFGWTTELVFFLIVVYVAYKFSGKYGLYDNMKNIAR